MDLTLILYKINIETLISVSVCVYAPLFISVPNLFYSHHRIIT